MEHVSSLSSQEVSTKVFGKVSLWEVCTSCVDERRLTPSGVVVLTRIVTQGTLLGSDGLLPRLLGDFSINHGLEAQLVPHTENQLDRELELGSYLENNIIKVRE